MNKCSYGCKYIGHPLQAKNITYFNVGTDIILAGNVALSGYDVWVCHHILIPMWDLIYMVAQPKYGFANLNPM